jgi:hypothetical protein
MVARLWLARNPSLRWQARISSQGFLPRLQAIFDAAEYLSSDDEF